MYASDEYKRTGSVLSDKQKIEDLTDEAVYDALEENLWITRKDHFSRMKLSK